jgi:hypothetical protein
MPCVFRQGSKQEAMIAMTYRVYSGPLGSEGIRPLEKDHLLFKEFGALDEAISWARHVNEGDRVALLIEGDDGTHLTTPEIALTLRHSDFEPGKKADVH